MITATDVLHPELTNEAKRYLNECVRRANGLLPDSIYEELWQLSSRAGGGNYVEVGTAHGAATIALALGAKAAKSAVNIHTIDRMGGKFSSRSRFGSVETNRDIAVDNFRFAEVDDCILLFVGSTDELIGQGACPRKIDLLMLDADGRIDRDLAYFYELMAPGTPVVIDDTDGGVYLSQAADGSNYIDLKHRITILLLSAFQAAGFLEVDKVVCATAFCRRGRRALDAAEFSRISLACYRELVFSSVSGKFWNDVLSWIARRNEVAQALWIRDAIPPCVVRIGRILRRLGLLRVPH